MAAAAPISAFNLTCPIGGSFHVCTSTTVPFLGCCTVDPCTPTLDGRCPTANLRAASFGADAYEDLPRQDCDDPESIRIWYTCKFNNPPFVGCCASNACGEGLCAPQDLRPAKLSGDEKLRALFLNPSGTTTSATTAAVESSTAAPVSSATSSPTSTGTVVAAVVEGASGGLSIGAIVGVVAGVVALGVIIFGAYKFGGARKKRKGEATGLMPEGAGAGAAYQQTDSRDYGPPPFGDEGKLSHGFGAQRSHYRDSTMSGSTAFGSPSMTQHATFPSPYDAKSLSVLSPGPEYGRHSPGRHSMVSDVYQPSPYSNGNAYPAPHHTGFPAVELPVTAPSIQELPAAEVTGQPSPRYAPSELFSGDSTPQNGTPLPSPRFPDERAGGHGDAYGHGGGYGQGR